MFPSRQSDDLVYHHEIPSRQSDDLVYHHEIPSSISFWNPQDLIVNLHDHVNIGGINTSLPAASNTGTKKRERDQPQSKLNSATIVGGKDVDIHQKLVHRDVERQRRKDISKLYASLGDLLPLDFVKGKRSIPDLIHQAEKYINHMEENINVLSAKRDQLKKFVESSEKESLMHLLPNTISFNSSSNGRSIEIRINSCLFEDGFPHSDLLKALIEEGLDIRTCTCRKENSRLLHCIQCEVRDTTILSNLAMLQQKLTVIANN